MASKRRRKARAYDQWAMRLYEQTRNQPLIPAEQVFRKLGSKLEDFIPQRGRKKPRRTPT